MSSGSDMYFLKDPSGCHLENVLERVRVETGRPVRKCISFLLLL